MFARTICDTNTFLSIHLYHQGNNEHLEDVKYATSCVRLAQTCKRKVCQFSKMNFRKFETRHRLRNQVRGCLLCLSHTNVWIVCVPPRPTALCPAEGAQRTGITNVAVARPIGAYACMHDYSGCSPSWTSFHSCSCVNIFFFVCIQQSRSGRFLSTEVSALIGTRKRRQSTCCPGSL